MRCIRFAIVFSVLMFCSSCGYAKLLDIAEKSDVFWSKQGVIALARPVPAIVAAQSSEMPGFMPTLQAIKASDSSWLSINRKNNSIEIKTGDKVIGEIKANGVEELSPGTYQIVHKQRRPLWYAPDSYFVEREIEVPPEGDQSRYLRGALGDFVLFLDRETPIHNSPIWCKDVGGIQMQETDISKLYYMLEIGSNVVIK